jgi:hypothetical protein
MNLQRSLIVAVASVLVSVGVVDGQSLGDVARRETERRKEVQAPGKVYTNDNIRGDSTAPATPAPAAPAAAATPTTPAPATGAQPKAGNKAQAEKSGAAKGEKYWKDRLADARTNIDRSKTFAEALQTRINALTADFSARSDPAQRNQIFADRQKALDELERVRKEIDEGTKAIADIQEEGRKAGVPAGWLR